MKILLAVDAAIPVEKYGGTERVVWYLAQALARKGHAIGIMARSLTRAVDFPVYIWDSSKPIAVQIPPGYDLIHFHFTPAEVQDVKIPYLITIHGNPDANFLFDLNSVFVSQNHAERYGAESFVYNGLDWSDYPEPDLTRKRSYFHFLGKAAWRVKNVQGAIDLVLRMKHEQLYVLGGKRLNLKMGFRWTLSPRIKFRGMVGGQEKADLINGSKGLVFPVLWPEPFGLAIIESLYYGCPVFGTPVGSLPELVQPGLGVLSTDDDVLLEAMKNAAVFNVEECHQFSRDKFNADRMAGDYLELYQKILDGVEINQRIPSLVPI